MNDFYIPKKTSHDHWYKEPWMLLVIGGPLIVVIAGLTTFYIAWHGADNVVSKDYYKQGININQALQQDAKAAKNQMQGNAKLDPTTRKITLQLESSAALPDTTQMTISTYTHASEFEAVQKVTLSQVKQGLYEGTSPTLSPPQIANTTMWYVKIEAADWRLTAEWPNPLTTPLHLTAQK